MKVLFLFMDGVGLGPSDPTCNPFARARMPHLQALLEGARLTREAAPRETRRASLLALDANLGVEGLPQSATGQATLLTGRNVPAELTYHYGPKPNAEIAALLKQGNLLNALQKRGLQVSLLNAYPSRYFEGLRSGKRLPGAIAFTFLMAGVPLKTSRDLYAGQALSADFTGQAWREVLNYPDAPLLSLSESGQRMAELAQGVDLAFFEFWASDLTGHEQDMPGACRLLEAFDQVLGALVQAWDDQQGLILITSDHGNLEDLCTRRHTYNPVPALLIGAPRHRQTFRAALRDLAGIAPAILRMYA
jgi:bisphosphoglycerate-independent phosphoglycerate mutase (AlkP superfamily)